MFWKKIKIQALSSTCIFMSIALSSCLKLDNFDKPYQQETYTVSYDVYTAIEDYVGASATNVVTIRTDSKGEYAYIYNMPSAEAFYIIPELVIKKMEDDYAKFGQTLDFNPPQVSGFKAEVIDANTLKIIDFKQKTPSVDEFKVRVSGVLKKSNSLIFIKEPIRIYFEEAGIVNDKLEELAKKLVHKETKKTVADLSDDARVDVYTIMSQGPGLTVL